MLNDTTANVPVELPKKEARPAWEKPQLTEVSQSVMAQPYIRFT
jgi:hypothetical protein